MTKAGKFSDAEMEYRVIAREQITVPASTFDAFRIEGDGWSTGNFPGKSNIKPKYWIAPGVRRPVATEIYRRNSVSGKVFSNERTELVAYSQR